MTVPFSAKERNEAPEKRNNGTERLARVRESERRSVPFPVPYWPERRSVYESSTPAERTALYRHFDADGRLLYVGISIDGVKRTKQHSKSAHWFKQIERVEIEWRPTRADALKAEAYAISSENPEFNIIRPNLNSVADKLVAFAIQDIDTGMIDGWYRDLEDMPEMFRYFSEELPGRDLRIVGLRDGEHLHITDDIWLTKMIYARDDASACTLCGSHTHNRSKCPWQV